MGDGQIRGPPGSLLESTDRDHQPAIDCVNQREGKIGYTRLWPAFLPNHLHFSRPAS